jgi:tetratricopeptide (TPR) repeat protein
VNSTSANTIPFLIETAFTHWEGAHADAETLGRIGVELESRSRLPEARAVLERALFLSPLQHPEWYLSLAFAHFRDVTGNYSPDGERLMTDGIEETDSDYLKASYLAMFDGNQNEAELRDMIDYLTASDDVSVRFALGHSLLWRGEAERALVLLREAVQTLNDDDVPLGLDSYCGALNWMRGQGMAIDLPGEVQPYLARLVHFYPNVYNYRALTIQMHQTLRDYDAVRTAALETLRNFPDEETTMLALGTASERQGNDVEAALWYNRAIGAKPSFARARIMLGKLYERTGSLMLAEQTFREIAGAFPEYHAGKVEIAYFLKRKGNLAEATSLFRYAYDHLKTFEKASVEQHPEGKQFVAEMYALDLPILRN